MSTKCNPADIASRGASARNLIDSIRLNGPEFLSKADLPLAVSDKTLHLGDPKVKSQNLATTSVNLSTGLLEKLHKISEWKGMLNALGTLINRVSSKSSRTERKRKARNLIIR